jgi:hypothetical protein
VKWHAVVITVERSARQRQSGHHLPGATKGA